MISIKTEKVKYEIIVGIIESWCCRETIEIDS
jgi:hypothetical protein